MNSNKQIEMNGKNSATISNIEKVAANFSYIYIDICIIQQALFKQQTEKDDIKKSIGDQQSLIYYSLFRKRKQNSDKEIYNDQIENTKDINIKLSKQYFIDTQFNNKLFEFQSYKQRQLERIAQIKDKRQSQMLLELLDQLQMEENQDFLFQVVNLYMVLKEGLNQEYQNVVLLHQNFHPKHNLLLHISSVIQSIFCQGITINNNKEYEQNQIIDFPKFAYINLTGHESLDNLQFWTDINYYYQNFCLYFSISDSQKCQNFKPNHRQIIIPSSKNIIQEFEMKIIFNFYIRTKLIQLKPTIIYVDICNTEQFSINLTALEKLLKKLRKFGRVVIHIKYDMNSQNLEKSSLEFSRTLNACLFGLQRIYNVGKFQSYRLILEKIDDSINYIDKTIKDNFKQNQLVNYLQQQKLCLQGKKNHIIQMRRKKRRFFLIWEKDHYLITALNQQKKIIKFDRVVISYQNKIIILLDFNNQKFYYHCFKDLSTNVNDSQKNQDEKFVFTEFKENQFLKGKIINVIVIINQQYILFAYPIINDQNIQENNENEYQKLKGNEDVILSYSLVENNWQIIQRDQKNYKIGDTLYFEDNTKTEQLIKQLREQKIVGQTVCYQSNTLLQEYFQGYQIYSLFGGEIIDSFKPMNLIEYLFVDVKNNYFFSKFIKRRTNPYEGSLKPSPYQLVLPIRNFQSLGKDCEIICAYLILRPWNQTKNNYYEAMLNPQNLCNAQLVFFWIHEKSKDKYRTIFIDIQYKVSNDSEYRFNILELINEDVNWIDIEDQNESQSQINNNQWRWKAIYTNYMKIKNLQFLTKQKTQDNLKKDQKTKIQNEDNFEKDILKGLFFTFEFTISLTQKKNKQNEKSGQLFTDRQIDYPKQSNDDNSKIQSNKLIDKSETSLSESGQINPYQKLSLFNSDNWSVQTEISWYEKGEK
ncbi:unnamed protein product [Paramecium pentaurelia]|uniref:Uncharacterized protein n=1 Tax=Paramecium pentaurelia TaxID=43138 RepID=A0A8S1T858_9CILI|nr:unnamed protein product [Paramecium pentaurelia]